MAQRVAFIVQRYGEEITGGSEAHCRMVAEYMTRHWQVEVLTTCAKDYVSWQNHYPAGTEQLNGVTVRRFPVAFTRKKWLFDRCYDLLVLLNQPDKPRRFGRLINPILKLCNTFAAAIGIKRPLERLWMVLQGPHCPRLTQHLKTSSYDAVIGFSYVYSTCYFGFTEGLREGRNSSAALKVLVPTAHDDPALQFGIFDELFAGVDVILANTEEERQLLQRRFPALALASGSEAKTIAPKVQVVGCGIDLPPVSEQPEPSEVAARVEAFKARHAIDRPYAVYVGRIEAFKGCGDLLAQFRDDQQGDLALLLVGKAEMPIPSRAESGGTIISLGFVSDQDKELAIAGSEFLVMPSPYESLSLVLLEAWHLGKPVLVNGACAVLKGQCQRSGGGLWFDSWQDFTPQLAKLRQQITAKAQATDEQPYPPDKLRAFVANNYSWAAIGSKYRKLLPKEER